MICMGPIPASMRGIKLTMQGLCSEVSKRSAQVRSACVTLPRPRLLVVTAAWQEAA